MLNLSGDSSSVPSSLLPVVSLRMLLHLRHLRVVADKHHGEQCAADLAKLTGNKLMALSRGNETITFLLCIFS